MTKEDLKVELTLAMVGKTTLANQEEAMEKKARVINKFVNLIMKNFEEKDEEEVAEE